MVHSDSPTLVDSTHQATQMAAKGSCIRLGGYTGGHKHQHKQGAHERGGHTHAARSSHTVPCWTPESHGSSRDSHEHVRRIPRMVPRFTPGSHDSPDTMHERSWRTSRMKTCWSPGSFGSSNSSLPEPLFVRFDSDVERGEPVFENVKLSVLGMTCSGCERKLRKALEKIPAIKDIQTDLVLAQALFCIDITMMEVEDVIVQLRRMTAYSFERVSQVQAGEQYLDIIVDGADAFFERQPPRGVRALEQLGGEDKHGKSTVRIFYNPDEVLSRDLLESPSPTGYGLQDIQLAPIPPPSSVTAGKKQVRRELIYFVVSSVFTAPIMVFSWAPLPIDRFTEDAVSLFLATIVQAVAAWEFYPSSFKSLFHSKLADMDLLIVLSTTTAYIFSVVTFAFRGAKHPLAVGSFFETSTLLVTLIRLGRFISELARQKATESVSIRSLQALTTLLLEKNRIDTKAIDVRLLQKGDVFRVPPHTRIPTDGIVVYGGSQVDESMMTGESQPVAKGIDSKVTAGTMNLDGQMDVALRLMPWENSISQIGNLVDSAELSKPKSQALADRVASYFVPAIIAVTCIVFISWMLIGILVFNESKSQSAVDALSYAIATLIISCPCAIGLAVPMVIVIASGVAAKHGVVFRAPSAIETTRKVAHVVFDKTGTLTEGKMSVVHEEYMLKPSVSTMPHLVGLVSDNQHPVAAAIYRHLQEKGFRHGTNFESTTVVVGSGIEGKIDDLVVRAGNCRWLDVHTSSTARNFISGLSNNVTEAHHNQLGYSVFGMTLNGDLCALFALRDTLRPEAIQVVSALQNREIAVSMVSGDDSRSVQRAAELLSIPLSNTRSRCSPAGKQEYMQSLQQQLSPTKTNASTPITIFCGDGTNDAVALTQASIGISITTGTDVAKSAADIVLVRPDLRGLLVAMDISSRAVRRVRFNFLWAAVYNIFAILLAAGAFVSLKAHSVRIPPQLAGLGEIASVLPVILIAFSLKFAPFDRLRSGWKRA